MSHTLFGDLHLEAGTGKGTSYWWPLIFEALGKGSFHLSTPGQPQGIVSYWHRQPNPPTNAGGFVGIAAAATD
jgi:hypothetical protein